jgi:hypothetical protein
MAAQTRAPRKVRQRLDWQQHVNDLNEEKSSSFDVLYRMSIQTFQQLHKLLQDDLTHHSNNPNMPPITSEIMLHCLLRYLAGGKCGDIRVVAGISEPSFYRVLHATMDAILANEQLKLVVPTTTAELDRAAAEFSARSAHHTITGAIAALDGWLVETIAPTKSNEVSTQAYYNGHYQRFGLNVQLACNSRCEFVSVIVAAPGGTNDIAAYRHTQYAKYIETLPPGRYVLADNAYICTEHLLTPFYGASKMDKQLDTFNFYLSQLRITIERTIGMLVQRWQLFKTPILADLPTVSKAVQCAARLHNFIVQHQHYDSLQKIRMASSPESMEVQDAIMYTGMDVNVRGNSVMRQIIVDDIHNNALTRPHYNVLRNSSNVNRVNV